MKGGDRSIGRIIFSGLIKNAIRIGCITFDIDEEEVVSALKVPYFRKGIINVLNGIGDMA